MKYQAWRKKNPHFLIFLKMSLPYLLAKTFFKSPMTFEKKTHYYLKHTEKQDKINLFPSFWIPLRTTPFYDLIKEVLLYKFVKHKETVPFPCMIHLQA